jgi:uncharacterized cupin superfamily protein
MPDQKNSPLIIRAGDESQGVHTANHPWNDKSEITMNELARRAGLSRAIVKHAVIPPGKEGFVYHSHVCDEEWIYVLSGTCTLEIDDAEFEMGPGDFAGFPTPPAVSPVAHHMRNDGTQPLIILMGGEAHDVEIADFPRLGKRKVIGVGKVQVVDLPEG